MSSTVSSAGEIRNSIFAYALSDYEDASRTYSDATCYKRPSYLAPRRSDTALLRTCRQIYQEAWFIPWASAEHAFYLAWNTRSPPRVTSVESMQETLDLLHARGVDIEVKHVLLFAQLCRLEDGSHLSEILEMHHFRPKKLTVTIRHTDWWSWENDAPLQIGADWVNECRFPDSVGEVSVAFESLERKRHQVDYIAAQASETWTFRRNDGTVMRARKDGAAEVTRWTGMSTWEEQRWIRDESRPNQLDYYVLTVTWRPQHTARCQEITNTDCEDCLARHLTVPCPENESNMPEESPELDASDIPSGLSEDVYPAYLSVSDMEAAGVPADCPGERAREIVEEWQSGA
ncbi:hypothetical protein H2203_003056 [Taxawa tesnikishii (nom. ined.)]|nr:hypothetical protein H2203_003056 [Dothideales sp. JES 119]